MLINNSSKRTFISFKHLNNVNYVFIMGKCLKVKQIIAGKYERILKVKNVLTSYLQQKSNVSRRRKRERG